jgi:hypothetical protein
MESPRHKSSILSSIEPNASEVEDVSSSFYGNDLVTKSSITKIGPFKKQKTITIDASQRFDGQFASSYDSLKYNMYHHADLICFLLLIAFICFQIFGDVEQYKSTYFDINALLTNSIMIISIYYSSTLALKGYDLSVKVHRIVTGNTPRVDEK